MFRVLTVIMVFLLVGVSVEAKSMEIQVHKEDSSRIMFTGSIVEGDAAKFEEYLKTNVVASIALYSGGGLVSEGIKLAKLIAASGASTEVLAGMRCYSICSLIWAAGYERNVEWGGELGVHQPYAPDEYIASIGAKIYAKDNMRTVAYMMYTLESIDRPVHAMFWMYLLNTDQDGMYVFTQEEIALLVR